MSLADRIAKIDARVDARKTESAAIRQAMPLFAAKVDELRRVFGEVKVRYAEENGHRRGKPFQGRTMNADEWTRFVKTGEGWERVYA